MKTILANSSALLLALQVSANPALADTVKLDALIEQKYPELERVYRDIHSNPEHSDRKAAGS